uniref:N-acetyltransferase 16 (putative) n=1 Tax=Mustela putorius furo TaxID=9669 RepID=M3YWQ3_MUSPF
TEREFEEVLAISGGISGLDDYVPSHYHSRLLDPDGTMVLAKRKAVVRVGAQSVPLIDARETVLVEGLRVAPRERGKGVARQHLGVRVAQLTRDNQLGPRELKKYRPVTQQGPKDPDLGLCPFPGPPLSYRLICFPPFPSPRRPRTPHRPRPSLGIQAHIQRHASCSRRASRGTIIQDWQPYRPRESSPRPLAAKAWSGAWQPRVLTLCTRPFPISHGGDGTWRYLNISAFGSDDAQVQSQLLRHLQPQAPHLAGLIVLCRLFLAPQLCSQLADFCQAGRGLELVKGDTEQHLLEAAI